MIDTDENHALRAPSHQKYQDRRTKTSGVRWNIGKISRALHAQLEAFFLYSSDRHFVFLRRS